MNNQVRIIGGKWRGRRISFPPLPGLRPTPDRVRETLFNWITPILEGAVCLDLFAGSGALGFEALSRGARWVSFFDCSARVVRALQAQIGRLETSHAAAAFQKTVPFQSTEGLVSPQIVFVDPPFHQGWIPITVDWLETQVSFANTAWLYLEHEVTMPFSTLLPSHWQPFRESHTGQLRFSLWKRCLRP